MWEVGGAILVILQYWFCCRALRNARPLSAIGDQRIGVCEGFRGVEGGICCELARGVLRGRVGGGRGGRKVEGDGGASSSMLDIGLG